MKFVFVFTLFLILGSMLAGVTAEVCTEQFDPVCGVNGITYGNQCKLDNAGVGLAHKGEC